MHILAQYTGVHGNSQHCTWSVSLNQTEVLYHWAYIAKWSTCCSQILASDWRSEHKLSYSFVWCNKLKTQDSPQDSKEVQSSIWSVQCWLSAESLDGWVRAVKVRPLHSQHAIVSEPVSVIISGLIAQKKWCFVHVQVGQCRGEVSPRQVLVRMLWSPLAIRSPLYQVKNCSIKRWSISYLFICLFACLFVCCSGERGLLRGFLKY